MKKIKVALFSNHPTQWESPFFGFFNRNSDIKLEIYYESKLGVDESIIEEESGFKVRFDNSGILSDYEYYFNTADVSFSDITKKLSKKYDAFIIEGHTSSIRRKVILYGLLNKIPLIYRSDSTLLYETNISKRILKRLLLPLFFKIFKAFLPLSSAASQFLKHYGVEDEKIFISPYMVDNDWYSREAENWRREDDLKEKLGLTSFKQIALSILRFEDRENPLEFLTAAEILKNKIPSLGFVLIGDGNQRKQVEEFIIEKALTNVVLPGYLSLSELPKYYAVADVFVHPAKQECWGLSVNEAMASNVPVIVSDRLGCRFDLIPSQENGFIYQLSDTKTLARLIETIISDRDSAINISNRAKKKLEEVSYNRAIVEFEQAINFSLRYK